MPLKTPCKLGNERVGQRRRGARHVGDEKNQVARRVLRHFQHAVGPGAGRLTFGVCRGNARGDAAQVLDQREPQHDRNRPQFAQQERLDRLIGSDKARQRAAADQAVAVRDELQRQVIHARQARRARAVRALRQARQLATVAARQMPPRGANFLFDQVEVVEQPLGRRRKPPLGVGRRGNCLARSMRTRSFDARRASRRSGTREGPSTCNVARRLPCLSICSALNSSARSGSSWLSVRQRPRPPKLVPTSPGELNHPGSKANRVPGHQVGASSTDKEGERVNLARGCSTRTPVPGGSDAGAGHPHRRTDASGPPLEGSFASTNGARGLPKLPGKAQIGR